MLSTMMAGNFLLVSLSLRTYAETGSAFAASLFFVAQFTASVLCFGIIEYLCRRLPPRHAMILADGLSLIAVLGIGVVGGGHLGLVFALLTLRGFGDSLLKSGRTLAIKTAFPDEILARSNALLAAPHYIGNGLGVVLAAVLVERIAFFQLALVAAGLIAVALLCYLACRFDDRPPEAAGQKTRVLGRIGAAFRDNPALQIAFLQISTLTVFFQGIHQVTRTTVPMDRFGLDASEAGGFQLAAVLGLVAGTLLTAQIPWVRDRGSTMLYIVLAAASLVAMWLVPWPLAGAAIYCAFMCAFEIGFIRAQTQMMRHATPQALATVTVLFHMIVFSGMAAMILAAGALTDLAGGLVVALLVAAISVAVNLALPRFFRRNAIMES